MAGPKIRIKLRAYDHRMLDVAARDIVEHVTRTGAKVVGPVPLPTERSIYTVIRSPHKYKDSREHFQMLTHKRHHRHRGRHLQDGAGASAPEPVRRGGHRDQVVGDMADVKGIVGQKLGMTQIFDDTHAIPVTVIQAGPCVVAQVKSEEARRLRGRPARLRRDAPRDVTKPMQGHFDQPRGRARPAATSWSSARRTPPATQPGQELRADMFAAGDAGRRRRRVEGQGVQRRHEASRVRRPRQQPRRARRSTARRAPSAPAPRPAACSRACAWRASTATSASPS